METLTNNNKRCLTCLVGVLSGAHSVFDVDHQLGVTLAAALWEVTRIEVKENGRLPIQLCADCRRKLSDAAGFARQAREANQHWLLIADCLQESTIDVKAIKNETEAVPILNVEISALESSDPIAVGRVACDDLTGDKEAPSGESAFSLSTNSNIDEDFRECSASARFSCNACAKTFAWKKDLQRHAKSHFLSPSFECEACGRQFLRKDKLKDHQRIHRSLLDPTNSEDADCGDPVSGDNSSEKMPQKCPTCDKVFVWPKDLKRHQRLHQPCGERHKCPFCERHFSRRDNLYTHIKTHGAKAYAEVCKKELRPQANAGVNEIGEHFCKPHGFKVIQCMVCSSKHSKIADLREHLLTHQTAVTWPIGEDSEVARIAKLLYPDETGPMAGDVLAARITSDVAANRLHHLYSISDELGYELSVDSSETESDSDTECSDFRPAEPKYSCDLCGLGEQRKYRMFAHQRERHASHEAKHVCDQCQRRFVSRQLLQHHWRHQCGNAAKRFQCRKCDTRFMWRDNLQVHLLACHTETTPSEAPEQPPSFDCGDCGRNFRMQKDLTRHMVMHRPDSAVFRCLWCPRRFYRIENLHRHVRRHDVSGDQLKAAECLMRATSQPHGRKQIQCRACNLPFDTVAALRAHIRRESAADTSPHRESSSLTYSIVDSLGYEMDLNDSSTEDEQLPPHQYTCALCNLVCKRKYEIVQHQLSIHKYELLPFRCQHCVYRTVCHELLAHHLSMHCMNTAKQYACDECPFKFTWQDNLEEHKKREHSEGKGVVNKEEEEAIVTSSTPREEDQLQPPDTKTFKCVHCPRKYNRKDRLSAHIKKFHDPETVVHARPARRRNPTANVSDVVQKVAVAKQKYLCAFCGRAVTSSSNLIIHMRRHTGEKPFKCDFCDMAFPRSSDLQCHRRTHTGEKPHQCTVCQKAFSRSYKLQTHMRIHNGERPYKCTYCEKSFTQSNDLTLHIRRHTGERPYVCDLCGERFIQGTALKYHRIMMHGQSEETVASCKN